MDNSLARIVQHLQTGAFEPAIAACRQLIRSHPDWAEVYKLLGNAHVQQGNLDAAAKAYAKAIAIQPDYAEAYNNLGSLAARRGQFAEAIAQYRKALSFQPDLAIAHWLLAQVLTQIGQTDAALDHKRRAFTVQPELFGAADCNDLGVQYAARGDLAEAAYSLEQAVQRQPKMAEAHQNLSEVYRQQEKYPEAIAAAQNALSLNPQLGVAHINLGLAQLQTLQVEAAIASLQTAVALMPQFPGAHVELGTAQIYADRVDAAIACYDRALAIDPHHVNAHQNKAVALLRRQQFREGFAEYEWRWQLPDWQQRRRFANAPWPGSPIPEDNLLIWNEQGVGDEIIYAQLIPAAIARCRHSVVECDARLVPLFARSFPQAEVVPRQYPPHPRTQQPDLHYQISSTDLFSRLQLELKDLSRSPYLVADPDKIARCRDRHRQWGTGLKVGISWHSTNKRKRPIPLTAWQPLLSIPSITWISLQYGDCDRAIADVREALGVTIHQDKAIDPLQSLDDFAAQVAAVDLTISISNTTVHLAGAIGKPVWTLLQFAPELWYWFDAGDTSPWYPTMRLFREAQPGDWGTALQHLAASLRAML